MSRIKHYLPLIFIVVFTIFFFHGLFSPLSIFSTPGDIAYFNYPLKDLLANSLKNFDLPLWNSLLGNGIPVFSESQIGTLYLPNLILFYLFETPLAFNLSYLFIFITSTCGIYLFCQSWGLSKTSSLFAALAFGYSGFFIARIIHFHFIQVVSFLPWLFLLVEKSIQTRKTVYLLLLSLLLSQLIFIGFPQAILYSLLALGAYFLFRLLPLAHHKTQLIKPIVFFSFAILLGVILSGIQLVPLLELLEASSRSTGLPTLTLFARSASPETFTMFFYPFIFGNPSLSTFKNESSLGFFWENIAYSGFLTPFLAATAFLSFKKEKNKKIILFFIVLTLISLLLATGKYGPAYIAYLFPPLSYFRIPARFLFLTSFAISILAAFSITHFQRKCKIFAKIIAPLLIIIICGDIIFNWYTYNPKTKAENYLQKPESVVYLENNNPQNLRVTSLWPYLLNPGKGGTYKQYSKSLIEGFYTLSPNLNLIFNVGTNDYYGSIFTRRFSLYSDLYFANIKEINETDAEINRVALNLLKLENVGFVISYFKINNDQLIPVSKSNYQEEELNYTIYKIKDPLPRIRVVKNLTKVENTSQLITKLIDDQIDFSKTAIVEKDFPSLNNPFTTYKISNLTDSQEELKFQVNLDGDGYLLVSDTFYPGWKAYVNNYESEIYPANAKHRMIFVPEGENQVKFKYQPDSLKFGAIISVVGILIFIFAYVLNLKKKYFRTLLD
ncbi:MAG TPA: YfhO family protein [Patescibacteria group bacterium]